MPSPSLNNPLKVTTANQMDRLLLTPGGQRLFHIKPRSMTPQNLKHESFQNSRPSVSFISQSRESPVPFCLSPLFNKKKEVKKKGISKEQIDFIQINHKMKGLEKECRQGFMSLDKIMPAWKRKSDFECLKKSLSKYQELKNDRLGIIKKQRIMKHAYQNGQDELFQGVGGRERQESII